MNMSLKKITKNQLLCILINFGYCHEQHEKLFQELTSSDNCHVILIGEVKIQMIINLFSFEKKKK